MSLKHILSVAIGGGLGAALRYLLLLLVKNQPFPYATLMINVLGSMLLGIIMAISIKNNQLSELSKLFLATGFCGGFTTFSTFSLDNMSLLQQGKYNLAFMYIAASVLAGIFATWLGFKLINQ